MKTLIFLIFATLVVLSLATTDSQKPIVNPCQEETGLSDEMKSKIRKLEFVDDPKVKKYLICVWKHLGLVNEDGEIIEDKLHERVKAVAQNEEEADKIWKKCKVQKDTPEETIFEMFKCLFSEFPKFSPVE